MVQARATADAGGNAILEAYQLLIDLSLEGGSAENLLRRALAVIATVPWAAPHLLYTAFLTDSGSGALQLAATVGGPADSWQTCRGVQAAACACGRALVAGRPMGMDGCTENLHTPCEPPGGGVHIMVPLASSQRVHGLIHVLLEPGARPSPLEEAFLPRAAALIGTELQRRRREEEHERLETQFLHAQKMEAVGRLAGGVAHDFNNILTAITSYSELGLLKLGAEHPLRRNFEEILAAADRAALLTQQLLAFSRRQILAPRLIDLNAIIADMGKMLRRLLGEDVDVVLKIGDGLPPVFADPAQVEQVLVNLAVNSRDAMPHGGKLLIETAAAQLDEQYATGHPDVVPGPYFSVAISDTGAGMSEEIRQRIFEPFFTTKEQRTGSGLGLAAVYGIIRQSGGHVQVYSEPGVGTTFRLYFPAAAGDAAPARMVRTADLPRGTETVLLAEDDDSVRAVIVEHLRDLGYEVIETREGRDALAAAALHTGPIDLLLTDVIMPGMSGRELALQIAAARPGLRTLYISGYTDEAIVQHGILEPGTEFLQKPFSPGALGIRVRQILDSPRPAATP